MKILLVDNYDSFSFNLLHYLEGESGQKVDVVRNDEIVAKNTEEYTHLVISPGPGLPADAGDLLDFISKNKEKKMLGVCLGQQAIAQSFGFELKQLDLVVHGQAREMKILKASQIFASLPKNIKVGRYHSWVVDSKIDQDEFDILAEDEKGHIMAIEHKRYPLTAVQFHPESILTEFGREMIRNWLGRSEA